MSATTQSAKTLSATTQSAKTLSATTLTRRLQRSAPVRALRRRRWSVLSPLRVQPIAFVAFAVLLVLGASAAALVVVRATGERLILERERAQAYAERDLLEEVGSEQGLTSLVAAVGRRSRYAVGGERYGLFDAGGRPLAGDLARAPSGVGDADWRLFRVGPPTPATLHIVSITLGDGALIVVGRDQTSLDQFGRAVRDGFAAALGIVLVAGLLGGLILNARTLRRVDAIAATAERIAGGDLSARTAMTDARDPFGRVGASLNAMLDRIEDLMTGMRTVTDSLAHDLRSPLTRMKGALARALAEGADDEERLDAIEAAHGEIDRTLATLSAMLDIARAETGLSREMMQPVDVSALMAEVSDFFTPLIEDAGQRLTVDAAPLPVIAWAHEALLRQAVGNLLHNASLYAGAGAEVTVAVGEADDAVMLTVTDTGFGVPEDDRGRVQERFVRLDPARGGGGSGLGLAIAAACAKLHGGELRLEDNAPGLRAVLSIRRT